jgi:hypothetical protein
MAGLVPAIHVFLPGPGTKAWNLGSSPRMTVAGEVSAQLH